MPPPDINYAKLLENKRKSKNNSGEWLPKLVGDMIDDHANDWAAILKKEVEKEYPSSIFLITTENRHTVAFVVQKHVAQKGCFVYSLRLPEKFVTQFIKFGDARQIRITNRVIRQLLKFTKQINKSKLYSYIGVNCSSETLLK